MEALAIIERKESTRNTSDLAKKPGEVQLRASLVLVKKSSS